MMPSIYDETETETVVAKKARLKKERETFSNDIAKKVFARGVYDNERKQLLTFTGKTKVLPMYEKFYNAGWDSAEKRLAPERAAQEKASQENILYIKSVLDKLENEIAKARK